MKSKRKESLSDLFTPEEWAGQIREQAASSRAFILVEGPTDKRLFEHIFENGEIVCIAVGGKDMLYKTLNYMKNTPLLLEYAQKAVAVRDRDYTNPAEYPPHMYAYDCCAMELMLLYHPKMQYVLKNYYTVQERFPLDMMRRIAPFSLLRKDNDENGWGIDFESPGVLAGSERNMPNMKELYRIYEQKYPALKIRYEEYQHRADALSDSDLWNITNGHDICTLLGNHYQVGETLYRYSDINYCFQIIPIYQPEYFQDTELYRDSLSTYELPNRTRPFQFESVTTSTPA